ncbi:hypothetical protein VZT92_011546 [Zoarces viviparus]|uniref:Uncharacterized protein n=1 Tax=Zoarces viviparus TaxID=48416 RepID=A0AAW1F6N2_ZOAVI
MAGDSKRFEEEEESTEILVCCVLSALQKLSEHLEVSKAVPGSVLDESPELIVSQTVLNKLLTRDELQTPQQHLQMYNSPLNIIMNAGKRCTKNVFTESAFQHESWDFVTSW